MEDGGYPRKTPDMSGMQYRSSDYQRPRYKMLWDVYNLGKTRSKYSNGSN